MVCLATAAGDKHGEPHLTLPLLSEMTGEAKLMIHHLDNFLSNSSQRMPFYPSCFYTRGATGRVRGRGKGPQTEVSWSKEAWPGALAVAAPGGSSKCKFSQILGNFHMTFTIERRVRSIHFMNTISKVINLGMIKT